MRDNEESRTALVSTRTTNSRYTPTSAEVAAHETRIVSERLEYRCCSDQLGKQ